MLHEREPAEGTAHEDRSASLGDRFFSGLARSRQRYERLEAARIVIAHRLSTVMGAYRILVLDRGRMVQCGSFRELMVPPGLFRELANWQLT